MTDPTVTDADRERARRWLASCQPDALRYGPEHVAGLASEFAAVAAEARRAALEEAWCELRRIEFDNNGLWREGVLNAASAIRSLMEKGNER